MSVLVTDLEVFNCIYDKAFSYTFRKTVDINFCNVFHKMTEKQIKNLVKNWLILNELTHVKEYKENVNPYLHELLVFDRSISTINTYQMLKYLECVCYNIDIENIKDLIDYEKKESFETLKKAIEQISISIIKEIPEYQNAKYSTA
jgi:hypothetical protein